MVERFIDAEPEVQAWDIWVEAVAGIGEAEKLNEKPLKAASFFDAVDKLAGSFKGRREFLGPKGENPSTLFHTQGGRWYKRSFEHPDDAMGRRLWPTEDQARGLKIWDVWAEGSDANEQREAAAQLNDSHIVADSFDRAVQQHINTLSAEAAATYSKDDEENVWLHDGRKLHPTESRARVLFG